MPPKLLPICTLGCSDAHLPPFPPPSCYDSRIDPDSILFIPHYDPFTPEASFSEGRGRWVAPRTCLSCSYDDERFCDRSLPTCKTCQRLGRDCARLDNTYEDPPLAPVLISKASQWLTSDSASKTGISSSGTRRKAVRVKGSQPTRRSTRNLSLRVEGHSSGSGITPTKTTSVKPNRTAGSEKNKSAPTTKQILLNVPSTPNKTKPKAAVCNWKRDWDTTSYASEFPTALGESVGAVLPDLWCESDDDLRVAFPYYRKPVNGFCCIDGLVRGLLIQGQALEGDTWSKECICINFEYTLTLAGWDGDPPEEIQNLIHNEHEEFACHLIVSSTYSNLPGVLPAGYAVLGSFLVVMVEQTSSSYPQSNSSTSKVTYRAHFVPCAPINNPWWFKLISPTSKSTRPTTQNFRASQANLYIPVASAFQIALQQCYPLFDYWKCDCCGKMCKRTLWAKLICSFCRLVTTLPNSSLFNRAMLLSDPKRPHYINWRHENGSSLLKSCGFAQERLTWDDNAQTMTYTPQNERLSEVLVAHVMPPLPLDAGNIFPNLRNVMGLSRPAEVSKMKESSLALYFLHLVGEGGISQHPEVKATAFGDISASDDVTAYISNHMLECAGRTFLQELEPWNQQVLILGDANTPLLKKTFNADASDSYIVFTIFGCDCEMTIRSIPLPKEKNSALHSPVKTNTYAPSQERVPIMLTCDFFDDPTLNHDEWGGINFSMDWESIGPLGPGIVSADATLVETTPWSCDDLPLPVDSAIKQGASDDDSMDVAFLDDIPLTANGSLDMPDLDVTMNDVNSFFGSSYFGATYQPTSVNNDQDALPTTSSPLWDPFYEPMDQELPTTDLSFHDQALPSVLPIGHSYDEAPTTIPSLFIDGPKTIAPFENLLSNSEWKAPAQPLPSTLFQPTQTSTPQKKPAAPKEKKANDLELYLKLQHGDFVAIKNTTSIRYSIKRKGFGILMVGRWMKKPQECA